MYSTITPVDESDTEFLTHPPRSLFPQVQTRHTSSPTGSFIKVSLPILPESQLYTHTKFYQIKAGKIDGTASNLFPLVITDHLPPVNGQPIMDATGNDILVIHPFGNFPYYMQSFVINIDNSIDFILWIILPIVKDLEIIELSFGRPGQPNGEDQDTVWTGYDRAWTMDSLPVKDLTGKSADGIETGGVTISPGVFGSALDFTGGNKLVTFPTFSITSNISVTTWVNYPVKNQDGMLVVKNPVNSQWQLFLTAAGLLKWRANLAAGVDVVIPTPPINKWHQIVVTQEGEVIKLYLNDELVAEEVNGFLSNGIGEITIGAFTSGFFYNGLVGHSTITTGILTLNDIKTRYNNQSDPDDFWNKSPLLTNGVPKILVTDENKRMKVIAS